VRQLQEKQIKGIILKKKKNQNTLFEGGIVRSKKKKRQDMNRGHQGMLN